MTTSQLLLVVGALAVGWLLGDVLRAAWRKLRAALKRKP
jgi:hypothetical protein